MALIERLRAAALTAVIVTGMATSAVAQAIPADPHHPDTPPAEASPPLVAPGDTEGQDRAAPPAQPGMTPPGMMGPGMMGPGMMGPGMMDQGMMSGMMMRPDVMGSTPIMRTHGHMMKIFFAIADADGDGGLSLDEIAAVHQRIFAKVDADKDGNVTPEELQTFMSE